MEKNLQMPKKVTVPEPDVKVAGKLSIDDILLSMGDKGKELARSRKAREEEEEAEVLSHGKEPAEESAAEENITREDSGELREFRKMKRYTKRNGNIRRKKRSTKKTGNIWKKKRSTKKKGNIRRKKRDLKRPVRIFRRSIQKKD